MKKVYSIPFFAPAMFFLVVTAYALILVIYAFMVLTGSSFAPNDFLLPALMTPLMAILVYIWASSRGQVVLDEDAVTVKHWLRPRRSMRYVEILEVRERDWHLPPRMVLTGRRGRLTISRRTDDFAGLYQALRLRIPTIVNRDLAATGAAAGTWSLRWTKRFYLENGIGGLILLGLLIGLFIVIVSQQETPGTIVIAGVIVGFLMLLIGLAFVNIELQPGQPNEYIFRSDEIRFRRPSKDWAWIPASALMRIDLRHELVQGEKQPRVVLVHSGGEELVINLRRARQFGCEPEQVYETLKGLYR
jgi:hypothetical protein